MCGLAGQLRAKGVDARQTERMGGELAHRGPDDSGLWHDDTVALAHRRLSVIDLSKDGAQPMQSADGHLVLAYNGEIYNFEQLRKQLDPHPWRGNSDTEVLLEGIARWGLTATLQRCVGMFALAVYDRRTRTLQLARDRLGIKPLYYGWIGDKLVFASELHAIRREFGHQLDINAGALGAYLRHYYTPIDQSIYTGIKKLPPACSLTINVDTTPGELAHPAAYWSAQTSEQLPATIADGELVDRFIAVARDAVSDRMVADVPLGAFLSGGLDSTFVCALMSEQSTQPINTFTMGFADPAFDEAPFAAAIAKHFGCRHHTDQISEADLLGAVGQLPQLLDEPFADSSLIPTLLVCRNARRHVTVALSGDGGDELLWGYRRYTLWQRLQPLVHLPKPLRKAAAAALRQPWLHQMIDRIPGSGTRHPWSHRARNLGELIASNTPLDLYHGLVSCFKAPQEWLYEGREANTLFHATDHWLHDLPDWRAISVADQLTYLPGDILTKVDRASMAVGLEARVPLLDQRLVALCNGLPKRACFRDGTQKWLLREALKRYVPGSLIDRPKQGFGVPIDDWLRGPLHEWMNDLLSSQQLRAQAYLQPEKVEALRVAHTERRGNWGPHLWTLCLFQLWLEGGMESASRH